MNCHWRTFFFCMGFHIRRYQLKLSMGKVKIQTSLISLSECDRRRCNAPFFPNTLFMGVSMMNIKTMKRPDHLSCTSCSNTASCIWILQYAKPRPIPILSTFMYLFSVCREVSRRYDKCFRQCVRALITSTGKKIDASQ